MNDLRFALRNLTKSPGYTLVAVAILALGIGLNTSMFSLMNFLILRPLPYPEKAQLVRLYRTSAQNANGNHSVSSFLDLKREAAGVINLAAHRQWGYTLTQPGRSAENLNGLRVSADFFSVLGLQPKLGRFFSPEEDNPANHVIILSHATWLARFGGDPAIIGRSVQIDGEATTIVGVLPEEFASLFLWGPGDAFRPMGASDTEKAAHEDTSIQIIGRFDRSLTLEQLTARLQTTYANLAGSRPREQSADGLRAVRLQDTTVPPGTGVGTSFLLALAGIVLLIVCANLASLQLARAVARTREFAIRAALGASRGHLLRPLLVESVILGALGGVFGILVTVWGNDWIARSMAASLPINFDIRIDWRVLAFAFALSLLTGVVFGLAPAWLSARVKVNDTLKSGARGATGDRAQHRFRNVLIVLQFAAVLVQLSCTGFFIRGMRTLLERNPGWTTAGVTQCVISPPATRYSQPAQTYAFYTRLEERLRALPGVDNVAIGWTAPLYQFLVNRSFIVDGHEPPAPGKEPLAMVNAITPTYLDTLRIRLVSGRPIAATDTATSSPVVMINEAMAKALFPNQDPVGQRLRTVGSAATAPAEIVGVFSDVGMAGNPSPVAIKFQVFKPLAQDTWNYVTVMVRSASGAPLTEPLRKAVNELDPAIPVQMLNTMDELAKVGTRGMELITKIFAAFSALGLFLAAMGLYGVITRLVMQRTAEIGVRLALGASLRDILNLVMGSGCKLALIGAGVGFVGSLGANLLMGYLFNNGSIEVDYLTLTITTTLLVLVALLASYLPARRATKIDPMSALRSD